MRLIGWLASVGMLALLTGCATFPPIPQRVAADPQAPFDAAALQAGMRPGHAIVRGQAFAKTVGGDVKYGAGNEIELMPMTAYVADCDLLLSAGAISGCAGKIAPYVRRVIADGEGRFEFDDIAPGKYLVETVITWGVPGPYGIEQTGGAVRATAEVQSDTDVITIYLQ